MSKASGVPEEQYLRMRRRILLANAAGAGVLCAYTAFLPGGPDTQGTHGRDLLISGVVLACYLAVTLPLGSVLGRRRFDSACLPEDGGERTDAQRVAILRTPAAIATMSFGFWLGGAALFGALNLAFASSGYQAARSVVAIILGGLVTSTLIALLVERSMRPLFAEVLAAGVVDRPTTLGIRSRLLLAWALGSGVFLLAIVMAPLGLARSSWDQLVAPLAALGVIGLVAGGVITYAAARTLADPLEELRAALGRIERGDLDVAVTVNDAGEIGMLQSGLNHTVAGLRERRRLEDLFGRQVGTEVAQAAVEAGIALGGQRAEASMLFVDLKGSTAFANTTAPEKVVAALNAFFAVVVREVHAEGGWVNKFEGDAALCVFGVPAGPADHAARALRAARSLRRELLALSVTQPGIDAGIGVSAGAIVAGNIGAEERYEYTVIGAPVNEAAHLTDEAKQRLGRVLASEEAVERAGVERASWQVAAEVTLRGSTLPILVYEPTLEAVPKVTPA